MRTSVAQCIFVALELRFEGIVCETLISGKSTQLRLRAPGTRAQELDKKLKDAHVSVDSGTHPPTLRETRASRAYGAPFRTEATRHQPCSRTRWSR